jgi:hypothetical protein
MTEQVSKTIHSVTDDIPLEGDIKKIQSCSIQSR